METSNERFPETRSACVRTLFNIKGSLAGRDIIISISPTERSNYVSPKCANQLVIPESNIVETNFFGKQYDISNLHLNIGYYTFTSKFTVQTLSFNDSDIVLGSPWMKTLGSFILNTKKKFLTFSYKKKKIMLQDVTLKPNSVTPEDISDISKVISHEGKKVLQNMQNEINKITIDKNGEVSRLKNHSEKLLMQIKILKKDKKSLENQVQQLIKKEASNVGIQVDDKTTNIDSVNVTTQDEDKQVEENTRLEFAVQTMNIPSECFITNSTTFSPEENIKIGTCSVRKNQTKRVPYRYPNHENRRINYATYLNQSEPKQQINDPKKSNVTSTQCYEDKSLQSFSDQNAIQKINLGWSNPFSVRQFCLSLRRSYQLVSTRMTIMRQKDFQRRKRDQAFFHRQALRTKLFEEGGNVTNKIYK